MTIQKGCFHNFILSHDDNGVTGKKYDKTEIRYYFLPVLLIIDGNSYKKAFCCTFLGNIELGL
jgi:hypothetical protein